MDYQQVCSITEKNNDQTITINGITNKLTCKGYVICPLRQSFSILFITKSSCFISFKVMLSRVYILMLDILYLVISLISLMVLIIFTRHKTPKKQNNRLKNTKI